MQVMVAFVNHMRGGGWLVVTHEPRTTGKLGMRASQRRRAMCMWPKGRVEWPGSLLWCIKSLLEYLSYFACNTEYIQNMGPLKI